MYSDAQACFNTSMLRLKEGKVKYEVDSSLFQYIHVEAKAYSGSCPECGDMFQYIHVEAKGCSIIGQ